MDPISTTALSTAITSLLKPATDTASARMLAALKALVRRIPGAHQRKAAGDLKALENGDTVGAPTLASILAQPLAKTEPSRRSFERGLLRRTW